MVVLCYIQSVIIGSKWCLEGNKNKQKNVPPNAVNIVTIMFDCKRIYSVYSSEYCGVNFSDYFICL